MKTTGGWTWKSSSPKECVTTHQSNVLALKIDDWELLNVDRTVKRKNIVTTSRLMCGHRPDAYPVMEGCSLASIDLGCSSNYSNEQSFNRRL